MQIRGYEDLQPIGRGGFGVVYRGRDRRFARDVAVKVLSGALDDTMTARFERECHAVGALSGHPHIVVVHDSGTTDDGLAYLVMELLSGGSLADRLAVTGPQGWPQVAELGMQLAGALETAHLGGVLHRDVKPENVLLSAYRQPKLVDFGIATVRGGFETKSASISASLAHAAPEILAGKRSSTESDVYALGSTLFQVLTGRPAFINADDETLFPLLTRISAHPVPDLRPRGVPDEVAAVIERSMAKAPEDRYPSALAFAQALQAATLANGQVVSNAVVMGDEHPTAAAAPVTAAVRAAPAVATVGSLTHQAVITPALAEQPTVTVPIAPRGRRGLALLAAALVLVAAGGGYVLLREGGGTTGPVAVTFASAADASVSTTRTWSLDEAGVVLRSDTALTNPSSTAVTRTAIEVIPKSVADDVRAVTFEPSATVIDADPVVRWQVKLTPGQVVHLRWTARLSAQATQADLEALAGDQRVAEMALVPRLAAIARAAGVSLASLVPFPGGVTPTPSASVAPTGSITPTPTVQPTGELPTELPTVAPTGLPSRLPTTSVTPTPSPALKVPTAPRGILIGYVQVVSYQGGDPNAESEKVSVKLTWLAPASGGAPTGYCVRWTVFAGTTIAGSPSTPTCVTSRSARITVPHVNPADSWLKWEVQARNQAGPSGWQHGLSIVPDLVGTRESSGVDKLRAAGLRVQFNGEVPDETHSCLITAQSPRSGTLKPATYVAITWKQCPP